MRLCQASKHLAIFSAGNRKQTIEFVEAELLADVKGVWRPVATASAWMMSTADTRDIERAFDKHVPGPEECSAVYIPLSDDWSGGYIESIEACAGATEELAETQIHWVRATYPIVLGEEPPAVPLGRTESV